MFEKVEKVFVEWLTRYVDDPKGFLPDPESHEQVPESAKETAKYFMRLWGEVNKSYLPPLPSDDGGTKIVG